MILEAGCSTRGGGWGHPAAAAAMPLPLEVPSCPKPHSALRKSRRRARLTARGGGVRLATLHVLAVDGMGVDDHVRGGAAAVLHGVRGEVPVLVLVPRVHLQPPPRLQPCVSRADPRACAWCTAHVVYGTCSAHARGQRACSSAKTWGGKCSSSAACFRLGRWAGAGGWGWGLGLGVGGWGLGGGEWVERGLGLKLGAAPEAYGCGPGPGLLLPGFGQGGWGLRPSACAAGR